MRGQIENAGSHSSVWPFALPPARNRVLRRGVLPDRSSSCIMAPRANWKGYLKLSLVSCGVALFPATTTRERVRFNIINRQTGNRVRYEVVDAETADEVPQDDRVKGYKAGDGYVLLEED